MHAVEYEELRSSSNVESTDVNEVTVSQEQNKKL